jgi:predicted flap endonuclease-1-like 5' DNA nuclease
VVGGGMLLILLAFIISSARGVQADTSALGNMLIIGAGLLVVGVLTWAFGSRPWKVHDDWSKPLYTGHEEHGPETSIATPAAPMEHMGAVEPEHPVVEIQIELSSPDDLTIIEGIGPKTAAALKKSGINSFAKLAALQAAAIEAIVRGAGVRMVGHADSWPQQARLAAEGKFDELRQYQANLKAGHEASSD